jgi:hypothetical protein
MLEVKRLLSLCVPDNADYRVKMENTARDEALLRGAHVLLCSHLEGYFEDLISDVVEAYDGLVDQINLLPEKLRAHQVMGAASKWEVKDPEKRWQFIQEWAVHPLVRLDGKKARSCLEADLHIKGFANPGTGEIRDLFATVGILDVWTSFKLLEPDQVVISTVDSIVNRRNQIAHGKADATITLTDAQLYVQRAERIAEIFSQIVTNEINKQLALQDCWTALEASSLG